MFYLKYLQKLIPQNFQRDTALIQKSRKAEEMLFIIEGNVLNKSSHRVFTAGSFIGETDIIYKRVRFIEP